MYAQVPSSKPRRRRRSRRRRRGGLGAVLRAAARLPGADGGAGRRAQVRAYVRTRPCGGGELARGRAAAGRVRARRMQEEQRKPSDRKKARVTSSGQWAVQARQRRAVRAQHGFAGGAAAQHCHAKRCPPAEVLQRKRGGGAWCSAQDRNDAGLIAISSMVQRGIAVAVLQLLPGAGGAGEEDGRKANCTSKISAPRVRAAPRRPR